MHVARLLTIVRVPEDRKLVCLAPGCGRGIYAAVHVIRDGEGAVRVIGSECFDKLSGHLEASKEGPAFGGWDGRRLSPEERDAMLADTATFVAQMEARFAAERATARAAEEEAAREQQAREQREREARARTRTARLPSRPLSLADFNPSEVAAALAAAMHQWQAKGVDAHLPGFRGLVEADALAILRAKRSGNG